MGNEFPFSLVTLERRGFLAGSVEQSRYDCRRNLDLASRGKEGKARESFANKERANFALCPRACIVPSGKIFPI